MSADARTPDRVLEAPGLACVALTPLMARAIADLPPGALLEVRSDDPAARLGVPAWCRLTRNPLDATFEGPDPANGLAAEQTIFHITKKPAVTDQSQITESSHITTKEH